MKILFWLGVLATILCFGFCIYDLCTGRYALAIILGICFVMDLISTIFYGIGVYDD